MLSFQDAPDENIEHDEKRKFVHISNDINHFYF